MNVTYVTAQLTIDGMHCGACALNIERTLKKMDGVERISVNGATKRAQLSWDSARIPLSRLLQAISDLGFQPHVVDEPAKAQVSGVGIDAGTKERRTALKRLAVAGLGMAQVMTFAFALYVGVGKGMDADIERYLRLVSLIVTIPVVFYSAVPFFTGAWRDLKTHRLGMDTPVALATALAFAASVFNTLRDHGEIYFDSVTMFVFLLLVARYVEMQARHRSGSVSEALAKLLPQKVQRFKGEQLETVELTDVSVGDRLLIPSGALIAADGRVIAGSGSVDESLLTGESTPIPRSTGDSVLGGSLNLGNPLQVEVTETGHRTVLAGIVRLLEQAQSSRAQLGRVADKAAAWFVSGILLLSAAVAVLWLFLDPARAFPATLAVLVVTCPCALSLATPTVIAVATSRLAKSGLLITHPDAIEALAHIRQVVFDKTGTLTEGTPRISLMVPLAQSEIDDCLKIAAALEQHSEHPLATAFTHVQTSLQTDNIQVIAGRGIEGEIGGKRYRIGQLGFAHELCPGAIVANTLTDSAIFLANESELLAAFEIEDFIRAGAYDAILSLHALGISTEIASGDHRETVERVARRLHIVSWHGRLTPEAKLERIRELNQHPGGVLMVGDGINDAPVLGAARASIAMGGGSALAHASADAILMSPSLTVLPEAVRVARRALHIVRQNLWWATGYNILAIPLAAAGAIPPWAAAIGMSLSSLIVVGNASRLSVKS